MSEDQLRELMSSIQRLQSMVPQAQSVAGSGPGPQMFGLGQAVVAYQPVGVSVPVTVPLPDGREVTVRVHFGPEAAQNLEAFCAHCLRLFGPYLAAKWPYRSTRTSSRYGVR